MSCFTHTCRHSVLLWTEAYILQLQRFYHRRLIRPGRARRGRGESLFPFGQARRAVARLQERALQFADVRLVLDHLCRRRGVLQWPVNHDTRR